MTNKEQKLNLFLKFFVFYLYTGFGVMVACDIIKIVNPSQVIQIESKDRKLNFPQKLEPGYVFSQNTEAFSGSPESLDFNLYVIPSGSESGTAIKSRY